MNFTQKILHYHLLLIASLGAIVGPLLDMSELPNSDRAVLEAIWNKQNAEMAYEALRAPKPFAALLGISGVVFDIIELVNSCFTTNCDRGCLLINDCVLVADGFTKAKEILHGRMHKLSI